jgi:hypothetical protein
MSNLNWKIKKALDAILKACGGDRHEALTVLMHIAAALFVNEAESKGKLHASASLNEWFFRLAQMCDGNFMADGGTMLDKQPPTLREAAKSVDVPVVDEPPTQRKPS